MSSPFPWRPEARQRVHDRCRDRRAADQHRADMSVLRLPDASALSDRDKHARDDERGGLNWHRNIDRNWELLTALAGARVSVPALYTAGDRDLVVSFPGMD